MIHVSNRSRIETAKIARLSANNRIHRIFSFESFMRVLHNPTGSRMSPPEGVSLSQTDSGSVSVDLRRLQRAGSGQVDRVTRTQCDHDSGHGEDLETELFHGFTRIVMDEILVVNSGGKLRSP